MMNTTVDSTIGRDSLAQQALLEHEILQHVVAALRLSLQWQVTAVGMAKKLSSVRFTAQSFQRHLDRILNLEEGGGYLRFVSEQRPGLTDKVLTLRTEHDDFRESLAQIMMSLEKVDESDIGPFDGICHELEDFLDRLDQHHTREVELIQEAMADVGGEG